MPKTQLHLTGTPGQRYSFVAKETIAPSGVGGWARGAIVYVPGGGRALVSYIPGGRNAIVRS